MNNSRRAARVVLAPLNPVPPLVGFLLLTALLVAPTSARAAGSYLPTGIYALVPRDDRTVDAAVLDHPDVTGLQIRASWATLQPRNAPPDFTYFDDLIALARSKNKKVIIAVHRGLVGDGLPKWLRGPFFTCLNRTRGSIPWDPAYKNAWIALWTQLVQRYEGDPTVTGYHIGGIYSWRTADWDLCDASPTDRQNWLKKGYRVELVQQFALEFAAALSAHTQSPLCCRSRAPWTTQAL